MKDQVRKLQYKLPNQKDERKRLQAQIRELRGAIKKINEREFDAEKVLKRVKQSNDRNDKRIVNLKQKISYFIQHKHKPEFILASSGLMSEYMQAFMISHNFDMDVSTQSVPQNLSYQQLLQLGEKIGVVSKGISKEEISKLKHFTNQTYKHKCIVCQEEFVKGAQMIILKCEHVYHEDCIMEWLKDQNTCPICKKHVIDGSLVQMIEQI